MASQNDHSIPLDFCHSQQNFRLLELPPELLDILTSKNAPVLSLKSSLPLSASSSFSPNSLVPSHAVLATQDKTFQLRQVQSSNSIFLLQPSLPSISGALPNLSIVAQCKATLELIPAPTSSITWLKELLPLYKGPQDQAEVHPSPAAQVKMGERISKLTLLTNLPISYDEFEKSWADMCAFEIDGQAWRPSAQSLVGVWKTIMSASTVQGIDIAHQFRINDVCETVEVDGYPREMVTAVLQKLSTVYSSPSYSTSLDMDKCICWVGTAMLEALGQQTTPISNFQEDWRNELPEQWRSSATLDILKGSYVQPTPTTIRIDFHGSDSTLSTSSSPSVASRPDKTVRKWHEKFKATRQ
ncbi:hypothetical protein MMC16_004363 [Acarospora aff. strigata]|nr:hypothetical protein [Acarospora aff. strigata]